VCAFGTALALSGNRFVATYALLAAPWCARDLDEWWRSRRWTRAGANSWREALATSALCVALPLYEWTHYENRFGIHPDDRREPVAACDFMQEHGIRGRAFNDFFLGGFQQENLVRSVLNPSSAPCVKKSNSLRDISRDYFDAESNREFVTEAAVAGTLVVMAIVPIMAGVFAVAHLLRVLPLF